MFNHIIIIIIINIIMMMMMIIFLQYVDIYLTDTEPVPSIDDDTLIVRHDLELVRMRILLKKYTS